MKKDCKLSRRSFLTTAAAGLAGSLITSCSSGERGGLLEPALTGSQPLKTAAGSGLPGLSSTSDMPMRLLGNTGLETSILSFGGGSRFLMLGEGDWQQALENSVQAGINLFDTAPASSSYGPDGESEKRYGAVLSEKYRDRVILSTKIDHRDPGRAESVVNQSFENLSTDVIDILQIHGLEPSDNLDSMLGENGLWEMMKRLKEEGRVRFIGATVMYDVNVALEFAQRAQPDVMLLAMNPFTKGRGTPYADFEDSVLQEIRSLGVGVLVMKALRELVGTGPGLMSLDKLLQYDWDLDVSTVIVGHEKLSELDENIELAYAQDQPTSLDPEELAYIRRVVKQRKYPPCWLCPGYEEARPGACG